jgi:hypothetical protein
MKRLMLFLSALLLAGCATLEINSTGKSPAQYGPIASVYVGNFQSSSPDVAQNVKNGIITSLLGTVKIIDSPEKADAAIEGAVFLSGESSSTAGGGGNHKGFIFGSGSSSRFYVKSASAVLKTKEGEIICSVSYGQEQGSIKWSGEANPSKVGTMIGNKFREYFTKTQ